MSTPITWNGVVYTVPAFGDTGYAQGSGNLSSYLIALAGGPFPYTSQTANPATAGIIRLAKTDTIDWRNNANLANLPLAINGSDQLTFNGTPLATNGGGTVNSGTAGHLAYYATTSTAVSDAAGHTMSGNYTFTAGLISVAALTATAGDIKTSANFTITDGVNDFFLNASGGLSGSYHVAVPSSQGAAGTILVNDGTGQTSWQQPFPLVAADPGSPVEGQVWYNTTTHLWKGYNGSAVRTFTTT